MHVFDQADHMLHRGVREHPMSEVEDMTRTSPGLLENLFHPSADHLPGCAQDGRIEIPLNAHLVPDRLPGLIERHTEIHADDITSGVAISAGL